mmetsp:Transcript_101661/g.140492  ORF Transcript_101661/g.140492 Transcript_101661/m.140492 type:complete len:120 (-) Transcript_101661:251-610(-)
MYFIGRIPNVKHAFGMDDLTSPTALERRFKMATKEEKTKMISEALDDEERVEKKARDAEDVRMRKQLEKQKTNLEQIKLRFGAISKSRYPLAIPSHPLTFNKHRHAILLEESRTYPLSL